jgi:hypothetical protein
MTTLEIIGLIVGWIVLSKLCLFIMEVIDDDLIDIDDNPLPLLIIMLSPIVFIILIILGSLYLIYNPIKYTKVVLNRLKEYRREKAYDRLEQLRKEVEELSRHTKRTI